MAQYDIILASKEIKKHFEKEIQKNGKENISQFFAGNGDFTESGVYDTGTGGTED